MAASVDFSLYLVTDSTKTILGNRDLVDVVNSAVRGGTSYTSKSHLTAIDLETRRLNRSI